MFGFLIAAVIAQVFNPIAELVIPTGIPTKEAKAEIFLEYAKLQNYQSMLPF